MDPALGQSQSPEINGKRKSEDGHSQQRAKRNRYTSIACNECKRRKIKCNGNQPCQRCGNLNLECVYAPNCCGSNFRDSEEYKMMTTQIAALQEQVDSLYANLSSLRAELAPTHTPIDPSLQSYNYTTTRSETSPQSMMSPTRRHRTKSQTGPRPPTFRGPTSNDFNFDVARNSLQTMGITSQGAEEGIVTENASPSGSPGPETRFHSSKDPIWSIPKEEALRLLAVYEEDMHEMYPVVSIPHVTSHIHYLYKFLHAATRSGLMQKGMPGADAIMDEDTTALKLVLAIALVVEGNGRSELAQRIFENVQPQVDSLLLGNASIKDIRILALSAMYEFHGDNEGTSWRIIGLTARLCIELGLHRSDIYHKMTEQDRDSAVLLFWSIYSLDRRWSFGTGMPFALQDADIDPAIPRPGNKSPYLNSMIDFCFICAKVWRSIGTNHSGSSPHDTTTKQDMGYLDYQIKQWHRNLPEYLHWSPIMTGQSDLDGAISPSNHRLRVILYLRRNSMLIHTYRPVLHAATSILSNRAQAQDVVDVAKDTIRVLTNLNRTSAVYRKSQALFNAFLTSALAVLFLAVSHTPAEFADQVREEFHMALDLVRGFSRGSWVSQRLWKTIRILKEVGPKLGLLTNQTQNGVENIQDDQSRSAALAMAGLAGHSIDEMALYGGSRMIGTPAGWYNNSASLASSSPDHMANDLTTLFEAARGYVGNDFGGGLGLGTAGTDGTDPYATTHMARTTMQQDGQLSNMNMPDHGGEDELSKIMRELF